MYMDINKCIIILILSVLFAGFIVGVVQSIVDINNKITEMFDEILFLKATSNNASSVINTIRENQTKIEKNLLTEIACLATKNNNDMKELKDKIITGKKSKRINQLIDENNKLKEENKKIKEENNKLKKEKSNKISNNNPFSYYRVPVYNPYTGMIRFHEHNVVDANNYKW